MTDTATMFERFGEVWETGDVDVVDELLPADVVYHLAPFPDMDRAGLKQFMSAFHDAFPDFSLTVQDAFDADGRSAHRWSCRGTLTGDSGLLPGPPTGAATEATGCHVVAWRDGVPIEIWHHGDWLGWLQKAGVVPALG